MNSRALALWAVALVSCRRPSVAQEMKQGRAYAEKRQDVQGSVTIHKPLALRSLQVSHGTTLGQGNEVACATCHDTFRPQPVLPERADVLGGPHKGLEFAHGNNRCASCHDTQRGDHLRLSTGEVVEATEAMRLCAQCHGPQWTSYQHGAHGGMTGYWDLRRGDRVRNHCVDCHDPHTPRFPTFRPLPMRVAGSSQEH